MRAASPIIRRRPDTPEAVAYRRGDIPVSELVLEDEVRPGGGTVLAALRGFDVGSVVWDQVGGSPRVVMVWVDPTYRRRGIAEKMVAYLAKRLHIDPREMTYASLTADGRSLLEGLSTRRVASAWRSR